MVRPRMHVARVGRTTPSAIRGDFGERTETIRNHSSARILVFAISREMSLKGADRSPKRTTTAERSATSITIKDARMTQRFFELAITRGLIGAVFIACTVRNPNYHGPHNDASVDAAPDGRSADAPPNDASARITAHWVMRTVAASASLPCPPGYDTAALYSQQVDVNGNDIGSPVVDLFPCNGLTAISAPLRSTTYDSWIDITNSNNTSIYGQSVNTFLDLTHGDKSFDTVIYNDGGYFQITWSLADAASGAALQCSQVANLDSIGILSTLVSTTTAFEDKYACKDHTGLTPVLSEGTYTVVVDALNSANQALGNSARIDGAQILGPNKVTPLGPITLPIDSP